LAEPPLSRAIDNKAVMTRQECLDLRAKLCQGLKDSFELMLRKKAQLDETIIISDEVGIPIEVSAKEYLAKYLAEKK
jgi:hypothetical protein